MKSLLNILTILSLTVISAQAHSRTRADGPDAFEGDPVHSKVDTSQVSVDRGEKRITMPQQTISQNDIASPKRDEATLLAAVAQASEWELVWADEFETDGLPDKTKWDYEEGFIRNQEKQYYTRERKENVRIENGVLVIEGRKEKFRNPLGKADTKDWQEQEFAQYTSGSINTLGKVEFKYGRIEVRAKVPSGKGMWPAIWMMGTNFKEVGWPRCGEIDIMEYVGKERDTIHATNHFADPKNKQKAVHKTGGGGKINIKEPFNDFHIYSAEWTEKEIKFFVDDKQYATFNIDLAGEGPDNPFRKPHFILLNLAIGGTWGGPVDDNVFPRKYEIDYVKYYKAKPKPEQNASGGQ